MRPSRLMYADGWASSERHQRQHFLFVGGALLALLFVAGVLPQPKKSMGSAPNLPVIRIHYELKRPPVVVIRTSQRMIASANRQAHVDSESAPFDLAESRIVEGFAQSVAPLRSQVSAGEPKKVGAQFATEAQAFQRSHHVSPLQVTQRTNSGLFDTTW